MQRYLLLCLGISFLLVEGLTTAASAAVCLRNKDIESTTSTDGKSLIVKMHDGKVWKNQLQGACPDLRFNGFAWVIRGPEGVCENTQSLQVLQSGQICVLGKFTPVKSTGH